MIYGNTSSNVRGVKEVGISDNLTVTGETTTKNLNITTTNSSGGTHLNYSDGKNYLTGETIIRGGPLTANSGATISGGVLTANSGATISGTLNANEGLVINGSRLTKDGVDLINRILAGTADVTLNTLSLGKPSASPGYWSPDRLKIYGGTGERGYVRKLDGYGWYPGITL